VNVLKSGFANFLVTQVEKLHGEDANSFKILFVLNNPPGHTFFCDYFHSNMKIVCLPPHHNSTLQPVDRGDCRLFLAYYQRRIICLGSK
jgi:hypothetical protein